MSHELRSKSTKIEFRDSDDGVKRLIGYAAVFYSEDDPGTQYDLTEEFCERVQRGAFDRALREMDDCRCLFNHDSNLILGRTSAETLRLSVDNIGLKYECELPDTELARMVYTACQRGDVNMCSFAFEIEDDDYSEEDERIVRTIRQVKLYDVSPCTYAAYQSTRVFARSELQPKTGWHADHRQRVLELLRREN